MILQEYAKLFLEEYRKATGNKHWEEEKKMRSDLEYYYVCDYTPQVRVKANIEAIELEHKEESESKFQRLMLSPADARELATMLLKAADHNEDLNKTEEK